MHYGYVCLNIYISTFKMTVENLNFVLYVISNDFFISFGIYTFLYLSISIFIKKEILYKIDTEVCKLMVFSGILYLSI